MRERTAAGSPPDFERIAAGMSRLRRHGYGAAASFTAIGAIGTREPIWTFATLLAAAGFAAGSGFSNPHRRLIAGLLIDHVVALSLWWMLGSGTVVDLIPIVIVSLSAFILPFRMAIFTTLTGMLLVAMRIPLHIAGSDSIFPMYWASGPVPLSEVAVSTFALLILAMAAATVFLRVGRLLEKSSTQLAKSAQRYRTLVEASPDGILIHQGGSLRYVNEAAAAMLGYRTPSAGIGMPYLDHIAPKDRTAEIERMHLVAEGRTTDLARIHLLRTDGSEQITEAVGIPTDLDGRPAVQVVMRDVSAREALRDTEQLFNTAFDSSVTGMAVVDVDGNYLRVNRAQCELFGYSEEEFLTMNWRDITHPDDLPDSEQAEADMLRGVGDDSFVLLKRYVGAGGRQLTAIVSVTLLRDQDGAPDYVYSHVVDMTEATAAAEALRTSEQRYRNLFERIPVAMYRSTPDGEVLDANPALVELMGFEARESLVNLASHEMYLDPSVRLGWKTAINRDGTVVGFEAQLRRKDGKVFWGQDTARIVRDSDGNTLYYEGAIIDVSAQKTAEQARNRLTRIIEATPDIVVVLDPSGWVTYANSAARRHFSIDESMEPPYLHVSQALDRATMRLLIEDIIPTLKEGEAWTGEFDLIAPDGSGLPVSAVGLAHLADDGSFARFSAVLRDVSEQVEATRQLKDLVQTKDEFVASVSHELRTPLTAVVGLAQELRDSWKMFDGEELEDLIRLIADQATEVSAIVQDLLVAARADIGTITISPTVIQVSEEVEAAIKTVPPDLTDRIQFDITSVSAWADPGRFRQIIRNLVSNALRYGGPSVRIHAHNGGGRAVINVTDDGAGIALEDRQRIFDPYYRAHDTPSQPASVGLGLSVSRQLAVLMGGDLSYDYSDGLSTFSVRLPAGRGPDALA
ncbi:MAG: PAS domain S-box protein [Acidimicrobiia bacterium]|nr:PAS domain S-box protein [Acidimicrobiia bacterium]